MKVFRFTQENLKYGERVVLIAAQNIMRAMELIDDQFSYLPDIIFEHELVEGLTYDGGEGIIELFYWEE